VREILIVAVVVSKQDRAGARSVFTCLDSGITDSLERIANAPANTAMNAIDRRARG
jgi:hypothetical protein